MVFSFLEIIEDSAYCEGSHVATSKKWCVQIIRFMVPVFLKLHVYKDLHHFNVCPPCSGILWPKASIKTDWRTWYL